MTSVEEEKVAAAAVDESASVASEESWDDRSMPQPAKCVSPTSLRLLVDVGPTPDTAARRRSINRIDVSQFKPDGFTDGLCLSP